MDPALHQFEVVRFGVFEADLLSGELRRSGDRVRVQELPFRALRLLVRRPGEVVNRDELRRELWPHDVHVDFERGISSTMNRLRATLGDTAAKPLFIETVERKGYRWIAPLHVVKPNQAEDAVAAAPRPFIVPPLAADSDISDSLSAQQNRAGHTLGRPQLRVAAALAVLLVLAAVAVVRWRPRVQPASTPSAVSNPQKPARNAAAEDFYLKGRYHWNKRTPSDLNQAVDYFTQAIVHDPGYAPAYVGLADSYNLLREFSVMPATEAYPRALAAAQQAVILDPRSADAHSSLGFASFWGFSRVVDADREFRRALELDPNDARAHHWYATFLGEIRRFPEAMTEIERARQLDPSSPAILADKGLLLILADQTTQAFDLLRQMEASDPSFVSTHQYLAPIYRMRGDYRSYFDQLETVARLQHDSQAQRILTEEELIFTRGGYPAVLQARLQRDLVRYAQGLATDFTLAADYAWLGKNEDALHYLENAYQQHDPAMCTLLVNIDLPTLHQEPRFQELVTKLGLAPQH